MKIAVLVSGGVDSSVALRLLKEEGHTLTAFYLKIWLEDELSFLGECPWEDDLAYVRAVCEQVDVPLEIVPFQKEYQERVVAYTIAEVRAGRTPNPDMLCNTRIKFGAFYNCVGNSYDKIATGHYAQVEKVMCHPRENGDPDATDLKLPDEKNSFSNVLSQRSLDSRLRGNDNKKCGNDKLYFLKCSLDPIKDQTYFLSQLTQAQIARAAFPIGKYNKGQVRELAKKFSLPNAKRKDSQGLCFLGKIPFDKFLEHHLGKRQGKLVEYETNKILGEHDGFWYFTVGQRRGIHLSGGPWYVVAKNTETNEVFISSAEQSVIEARNEFIVSNCNWIAGVSPVRHCEALRSNPEKAKLSIKVRHGEKMYLAKIEHLENNRLRVKLAEKDRGLAPGQFAVFYDGEYCLGGGVIG